MLARTARILFVSALLVPVLPGIAASSAPAQPNRTLSPTFGACTGAWEVQPSRTLGKGDNNLSAVSAIDSSDVWAVGSHEAGGVPQTLTEHWDGASVAAVPSPSLGKDVGNSLYGSAAVSSSDVWAVGSHFVLTPFANQSLTEHWDGFSWSVVRSPNLGKDSNYLVAASAVATNDVWAVGDYVRGTSYRTLTMHWDGSAWTILPSPNVGSADSYLTGVTAIATDDVWAVGYGGIPYQTVTLHWDGSSWTRIPNPVGGSDLRSVSAAASSDVWAVGEGTDGPLAEHWDGTAWTIVPTPDFGSSTAYLQGVVALSSSLTWAVGWYTDQVTGADRTLVEQWDGVAWTVVSSPNIGAVADFLFGVSASSSTDAWAVGQEFDGRYRALVLHFC